MVSVVAYESQELFELFDISGTGMDFTASDFSSRDDMPSSESKRPRQWIWVLKGDILSI